MNIRLCDFIEGAVWEPENDKQGLMAAIDELVSGPLDSFHIERMDDGCYAIELCKGEATQRIIISANNPRAKIVARTEADA